MTTRQFKALDFGDAFLRHVPAVIPAPKTTTLPEIGDSWAYGEDPAYPDEPFDLGITTPGTQQHPEEQAPPEDTYKVSQRQKRSRPTVGTEWSPDVLILISWLLAFEIPPESVFPFDLEPGIRVLGPKYFEALQRDIEIGPRGPRARMGALQADLRKLKAYFDTS